MAEEVTFEVINNRFWILEKRLDEEKAEEGKKKTKEDYRVTAWVFNNERAAIMQLKGLMAEEKIDFEKLDEIEKLGTKYNLQEVEIARDKYNMKAISWLKVALLGFAQK